MSGSKQNIAIIYLEEQRYRLYQCHPTDGMRRKALYSQLSGIKGHITRMRKFAENDGMWDEMIISFLTIMKLG